MSKKFYVSDEGWMSEALNAINNGEGVKVAVCGKDAEAILGRIGTTLAKLPSLSKFSSLLPKSPLGLLAGGTLPVDPTVIVPVLTAVGALGGAVGSAAFVAGVGVAHGMKVEFTMALNNLFDPSDDEVCIALTPA